MANTNTTTDMTRAMRKTRTGTVVSNRMQKTIIVRVDRLSRHPLFGRVLKKASKFKAHDETNDAKIGDVVTIVETRPLSKDKRWRLVEIVRRASSAPPVPGTEAAQTSLPSGASKASPIGTKKSREALASRGTEPEEASSA